MSSAPTIAVPPILTGQSADLPPPRPDDNSAPPTQLTANEDVAVGPPQQLLRMLDEVKTFPQDINALSVDASLVAYLSNIYQSEAMGPAGSFAAIPKPMPNSHRVRRITRTITKLAKWIGLADSWALVRKLGPSPLTDFSEAFRLFFGSNISIFPYLVSLGGTLGSICCTIPVAFLMDACVVMQCEAKDVAVNVVLKQLLIDDRAQFFMSDFAASPSKFSSDREKTTEQKLKELEDFSARHLSVSSYFRLSEVLWTYPKSHRKHHHLQTDAFYNMTGSTDGSVVPLQAISSLITSGEFEIDGSPQQHDSMITGVSPSSRVGNGAGVPAEVTDLFQQQQQHQQHAPQPGDPPQVEVRSYFPFLVRSIVLFAQFTSSCGFAMMLASNMFALFEESGITLNMSMIITCAIMNVTLCILNSKTIASFAAVNNVGLIGSSLILIVATLMHQNSDPAADGTPASPAAGDAAAVGGEEDSTWVFFRSTQDLFMFFPTLLAYLTPALFAMDVETNIARRSIPLCVARITNSINYAATPAAASTVEVKKDDVNVDGANTAPPSSMGGTAVDGITDQTLIMPGSKVLLRRFHYVTLAAFFVAVSVLLSFGEFVFAQFKSRTNAIVALSLRKGPMRTILLWDLLIGIFACTALNVAGLPNILDDMRICNRLGLTGIHKEVERVCLRTTVMIAVLMTLFVIPYFDLVASLAGCLGVNGFTLFLPVLLRLQSIRREYEVLAMSLESPGGDMFFGNSSAMGGGGALHVAPPSIGWWEAYVRVPTLRAKLSMIAMLLLGTAMLITGVASCTSQFLDRIQTSGTSF